MTTSVGRSFWRWIPRRRVALVLIGTSLFSQLYQSLHLVRQQRRITPEDHIFHSNWSARNDTLIGAAQPSSIRRQPELDAIQGAGACLMIKEDVDLLYEWMAYHYVVLPLRHVVIGSDIGNTEDPRELLQRWNTITNLQFTILPIQSIHNSSHPHPDDTKQESHHKFIHRQKAFVQACSLLLKEQGVQWTTFIDSDEFLVLNRVGADESQPSAAEEEPSTEANRSVFEVKRKLPSIDAKTPTIVDVLNEYSAEVRSTTCYTIPRLLVGSLENETCANAEEARSVVANDYRLASMSTLRFFQHATKGDFSASKFGKVMMDLSRIDATELQQTEPRSIHRPYKDHCGPGVVPFDSSLFFLNHYIGSWERYNRKDDQRRNRQEWEQRAYFNQGRSCDKGVHLWFPRFIERFGETRAKYLLGVADFY